MSKGQVADDCAGHKESCTPEVENLDLELLEDPETSTSEDQNKKKPAKIQKHFEKPKTRSEIYGFFTFESSTKRWKCNYCR